MAPAAAPQGQKRREWHSFGCAGQSHRLGVRALGRRRTPRENVAALRLGVTEVVEDVQRGGRVVEVEARGEEALEHDQHSRRRLPQPGTQRLDEARLLGAAPALRRHGGRCVRQQQAARELHERARQQHQQVEPRAARVVNGRTLLQQRSSEAAQREADSKGRRREADSNGRRRAGHALDALRVALS